MQKPYCPILQMIFRVTIVVMERNHMLRKSAVVELLLLCLGTAILSEDLTEMCRPFAIYKRYSYCILFSISRQIVQLVKHVDRSWIPVSVIYV